MLYDSLLIRAHTVISFESANAGSKNSMVLITRSGGFPLDTFQAPRKEKKGWSICASTENQRTHFPSKMFIQCRWRLDEIQKRTEPGISRTTETRRCFSSEEQDK